jgi:hypothetical protein
LHLGRRRSALPRPAQIHWQSSLQFQVSSALCPCGISTSRRNRLRWGR